MRHHRKSRKFGRQRSHYKATLKSLVANLVINKTILTTKVKAKEASRLADKLISLAKDNTLANQRRAYDILRDRKLVYMLFKELGPLFKDRQGGYTRVLLTKKRHGDNAQLAILEFVEKPKPPEPKKKAEKKEKKQAAPEIEAKTEKAVTQPEPKKEDIVVKEKKEEHKKEEHKKEAPQPKRPEKPAQKPGFFKKFFGRKGD